MSCRFHNNVFFFKFSVHLSVSHDIPRTSLMKHIPRRHVASHEFILPANLSQSSTSTVLTLLSLPLQRRKENLSPEIL